MMKAIVFDWHGVLDFTTLEQLLTLISQETNKPESEIKNIFKKINKSLTQGVENDSLLWRELNKNFDLSKEQLETIKDYGQKIEKNLELFSFLETIKNKYKFAILSDCPTQKAQKIKESIDLKIFDQVIFSCEVGKSKSEDEFFQDCAKKLGITNQNILYVDDTKKHTDRASSLGFQAHHFKDTEKFIKSIKTI